MAYDIREATTLFARARDAHDRQANYPDRVSAGELLVEAVAKAAQAVGLTVQAASHRAVSIRHPGKPTAYVSLDDDRILVGRQGGPGQQVHLAYDPLAKRFEGTEDAPFLVPTPGAPRQRRSAVAVVTERLVELMYMADSNGPSGSP